MMKKLIVPEWIKIVSVTFVLSALVVLLGHLSLIDFENHRWWKRGEDILDLFLPILLLGISARFVKTTSMLTYCLVSSISLVVILLLGYELSYQFLDLDKIEADYFEYLLTRNHDLEMNIFSEYSTSRLTESWWQKLVGVALTFVFNIILTVFFYGRFFQFSQGAHAVGK